MNDKHDFDADTWLRSLTPLPAPASLRSAVMCEVEQELARHRPIRWDRGLAIAASLLLAGGVAANYAVDRNAQHRLATLFGPDAAPRAVSDYTRFVKSVVDPEASAQLERYLLAIRPLRGKRSKERDEERRHVEAIMNALTLIGKGEWDAKNLEGHQVDRDRDADGFRGALDRRRDTELAREQTA